MRPEGSRPFVFISYNRATSAPWALLLKNEIQRQYSCDVFVDVAQSDTVGTIPNKLKRNIERCDVFVCLVGETTLSSPWVNSEIEIAYAAKKPMIPILQETFQVPRNLDQLPPHTQHLLLSDGVPLLDRRNVFVDATIKNLGEAIQQIISGSAKA